MEAGLFGCGTSLAFGLVCPDHQRRGLGTTLLAARLLAIIRSKGRFAVLRATEQSRKYLERIGFRFLLEEEQVRGTTTLYEGILEFSADDADFLADWLGPERCAAVDLAVVNASSRGDCSTPPDAAP